MGRGSSLLCGVCAVVFATAAMAQDDAPAPSAEAVGDKSDSERVEPAQVLRRPTGSEMSAVFPKAAETVDFQGEIKLHCTIDVTGLVGDCKVISERPQGLGLGEAGLKVAALYRYRPAKIDGKPVPSPLNITLPVTHHLVKAPAPKPSVKPKTVTWPTSSELEDAYPEGALDLRVEGKVRVTCDVEPSGAPANCAVIEETPAGYGFGESALALAGKMHFEYPESEPADARHKVTVPFTFNPKPKAAPKPPAAPSVRAAELIWLPVGFALLLLLGTGAALAVPGRRQLAYDDYR